MPGTRIAGAGVYLRAAERISVESAAPPVVVWRICGCPAFGTRCCAGLPDGCAVCPRGALCASIQFRLALCSARLRFRSRSSDTLARVRT